MVAEINNLCENQGYLINDDQVRFSETGLLLNADLPHDSPKSTTYPFISPEKTRDGGECERFLEACEKELRGEEENRKDEETGKGGKTVSEATKTKGYEGGKSWKWDEFKTMLESMNLEIVPKSVELGAKEKEKSSVKVGQKRELRNLEFNVNYDKALNSKGGAVSK